jgi:hypothetical protein
LGTSFSFGIAILFNRKRVRLHKTKSGILIAIV